MSNATPSQILLQGISTLSFFFLENLDSPIYFKIVLRIAALLSFQAERMLRKPSHVVTGVELVEERLIQATKQH